MRTTRPVIVISGLLAAGVLLVVARHLWIWRHYYLVRTDIDAAIAEAQPIIDELERVRALTGVYPQSLPRFQPHETSPAGSPQQRAWRYVPGTFGDDYELFCAHSHWVGTFNALVYSPDGVYQAEWLLQRTRERTGWLYVIGASDLNQTRMEWWRTMSGR